MTRKLVETKWQMGGKSYIMRMRDKLLAEDLVLNMAKHQAATYKQDRAPSRRETDLATKMALVRLNLEI